MTNILEGRIDKPRGGGTLIMPAIGVVTFAAFILLIVMVAGRLGASSQRSESYKDATGAAGLSATIGYTCSGQCAQKYDFNVYIFREDGQQAAIVRPNEKGQINVALPEGEYILLVSKQLNGKVFPEEHVSLKNGKQLELKLQYGRVAL